MLLFYPPLLRSVILSTIMIIVTEKELKKSPKEKSLIGQIGKSRVYLKKHEKTSKNARNDSNVIKNGNHTHLTFLMFTNFEINVISN